RIGASQFRQGATVPGSFPSDSRPAGRASRRWSKTDQTMSDAVNPLAPHHLPWFITAPGDTDGLLVGMGIFLLVVVIAVGNLYFQLHALPERWAHKRSPMQVQIVAILALLALFTHNHIFWIAALLLALVQFPDFATPMY